MNRNPPKTQSSPQQVNLQLCKALEHSQVMLARAADEIELLERRLSNATDKQILLLEKLIAVKEAVHLNASDVLPPVDCPLLVELPTGGLAKAQRPGYLTERGGQMQYRLDTGEVVTGRLRWTYP